MAFRYFVPYWLLFYERNSMAVFVLPELSVLVLEKCRKALLKRMGGGPFVFNPSCARGCLGLIVLLTTVPMELSMEEKLSHVAGRDWRIIFLKSLLLLGKGSKMDG